MVFKVCFTEVANKDNCKELNIDLDKNDTIIKDENNIVVGTISDFINLYNDFYYSEENSYYIDFHFVSIYHNIDIELSDSQVEDVLNSLGLYDVRL